MKRKGKMKGLHQLLAAICAVALLGGCGAGSMDNASFLNDGNSRAKSASSYNSDVAYAETADGLWNEGGMEQKGAQSSGDSLAKTSASKRKLIKNVSLNVETQEYATLMANLENRVKELGGYVQSMESRNGSSYGYGNGYGYGKNANLVLRIPQDRLDEFVNSVCELGNVTSRQENVEDVTLQYVDVKSHKESLEVEQKRLLELLERAEILEDIITLEERLTSVRYQIESMESTLRTFDDQVDYSTVRIRVDEVKVYTPVEEEELSTWQKMSQGFMESIYNLRDGAVRFSIWFVVKLPYIVIWTAVLTAAFLFIKKHRGKKDKAWKKAKGKKEVKAEEKAEEKAEDNTGNKTRE